MAAGMSSRYGGSKQITGMGPHGEILLDYSVTDAIRAGFDKVIFVIKPEMHDLLHAHCGARFASSIDVQYAYQDFTSIPYSIPKDRVKPFGTVHATLCAMPCIAEPFAVINADDYYGVESFAGMHDFLVSDAAEGHAAMMGYRLEHTLSRHGGVTRALCRVEDGYLTGIRESKNVHLLDDGRIGMPDDSGRIHILPGSLPVSMNFWGFDESILEVMMASFKDFFLNIPEGDITSEYLLPVFVGEQLRRGTLDVSVIPTSATWFGVTYREDRPAVAESLRALHEAGVY